MRGVRFMGRGHLQKLDAHRSHEPTPNPSGGRGVIQGTLAEFPSWEGQGVGRFMGRKSSRAMAVSVKRVAEKKDRITINRSFVDFRFAC